jgi:hypothetical protein
MTSPLHLAPSVTMANRRLYVQKPAQPDDYYSAAPSRFVQPRTRPEGTSPNSPGQQSQPLPRNAQIQQPSQVRSPGMGTTAPGHSPGAPPLGPVKP